MGPVAYLIWMAKEISDGTGSLFDINGKGNI